METGNIPVQYEMEKAIYSITSVNNKGRYFDILFRALTQGDLDSYQHIHIELMEQMGIDGASIESAMRSRYNKAIKDDPNFSMSQEARDLIGSRDRVTETKEETEKFSAGDLGPSDYQSYASQRAEDYREMANMLEDNPIFKGMSDEERDSVLKAAFDLANAEALEDASDGAYEITTKWMSLADDAEKKGIEPWAYVLFHAAYSMAETTRDEAGNAVDGASKNDHVRAWLEDFDGLTEQQRAFLWSTVYQSAW